MPHPKWVLKHRQKGTEIRSISGHYYLYRITSKWDPEKKRAKKITLGLVGTITEQGLISTEARKKERAKRNTTQALEYGATAILRKLGKSIEETLCKLLGEEDGKALYTCALIRSIEPCALKHINPLYEASYLSIVYNKVNLAPNQLTALFERIGRQRDKIVAFFKTYLTKSPHIIFDATNITTKSKELGINERGYNSHKNFDQQVNLLYMFSIDAQCPTYYRVIPGNIREVSAFRLCLEELKTNNGVIVADKGFVLKKNIELLREEKLNYILPLRRNNSNISYSAFKSLNYDKLDGYFVFQNRSIWYKATKKSEYGHLICFYDGKLAEQERQDYLARLDRGVDGYSLEDFKARQSRFGVLTIVTNIGKRKGEKEIYESFKSRMSIEQLFDTYKNTLEADRTYMRSRERIEAWLFMNHISLMLYYLLYSKLQSGGCLKNFSPSDVMRYGKQVRKVKYNNNWYTTEVSSKLKGLLNKLGLPIT